MWAYLIIPYDKVEIESGVVTVLFFSQKIRGQSLKSFHDFWDTLHFYSKIE